MQNGTDKQAIADNLLHHGSGGCSFKCGMVDIPIRTSRGTPAGASLFFIGENSPADGLAAAGKGNTRPAAESPAERATEAAAGIAC